MVLYTIVGFYRNVPLDTL